LSAIPPTGAASFDPEVLELFDREMEVDIETSAPGLRPRRTTIWIVVADGVPYIRSVRGERGRWYREIRARPAGAIHVNGRRIPVRAIPADDAASVKTCSAALSSKYSADASTPDMLLPEVLDTTLRLQPV
jgi:hypothetical protein